MKKSIVLLLSLCLLLALTACGKEEKNENSGLSEVNPGVENSAGDDASQGGSSAENEDASQNTEDGYFSLCEKGYANGLCENYFQKKPPMGMNNSNGF